MSKTFETKAMLIESLRSGRKTVTQLSEELGLSKATVSQHIAELKHMGKVVEDDNSHFRRMKYFKLSNSYSRGEAKAMPHWQVYGVVIAVVAAVIGGGAMAYYGAYAAAHAHTMSGVPSGTAPGAFACPALFFYSTANYSDVSTVVDGIASGSPCYLTYVNFSNSTLDIGTGTIYRSANGKVDVPGVGYSYTLTAGQIAKLESESSNGECWADNAMRFFNVSYMKPQSCVTGIYS